MSGVLEGRRVLVTGASSGIGEAVVRAQREIGVDAAAVAAQVVHALAQPPALHLREIVGRAHRPAELRRRKEPRCPSRSPPSVTATSCSWA